MRGHCTEHISQQEKRGEVKCGPGGCGDSLAEDRMNETRERASQRKDAFL